MFDHPQVLAEDLICSMQHPLLGTYRGIHRSIKFDQTPGPAPFSAPTLGQHSVQVLAQHGYSEEEIARLLSLGILT
jgi:crotonobetainyl-CoA:carnitine CoA-transferase CaiB-like acyl-CoA transferase